MRNPYPMTNMQDRHYWRVAILERKIDRRFSHQFANKCVDIADGMRKVDLLFASSFLTRIIATVKPVL